MYDKKSFEKVVEPVIKWLNDQCNPHSSIEITSQSAELRSGELSFITHKFIKD